MNTPDLKAIERAFYSDGFQLGMKAFENKQSDTDLSDAIQEVYKMIDLMIDSFSAYATQQHQKIDCKKGCSWCCYQPVFALDYELDYLNAFIKNNFTESRIQDIREKAGKKMEKLNGLGNEEILNSKFACPLLEDGACSAYTARPVACRIYLSSEVNSCIKFYNDPEDKNSFPAALNFPMRMGRMVNEGFKAALKQNGRTSKEYRVEQGLLSAFS